LESDEFNPTQVERKEPHSSATLEHEWELVDWMYLGSKVTSLL